jgi:hypothetical protein
MAKIYNFEVHKLQKELNTLRMFLHEKYSMERAYKMIWFDHYSIITTQQRIAEIEKKLQEIANDTKSPEK